MTNDVKTYSNKSNAKRAIVTVGPEYAAIVANDFITSVQGGFIVDLNEVSKYEQDAREKVISANKQRAVEFQKASEIKAVVKEPSTNKKEISHSSSIVRPCKRVWFIADEMIGKSRKEVLEACQKEGIAFHTARTQYQQWSTVQREMKEREAKNGK
jgi:hypothetical protein